ncbi:MAG: acetyl-CoA carboxylase biotin carboxyl carrier protein [Candidatus Omnitrophota bacterium]
MNLKEIKEMINLMNENNLMELEVEKDGMRIRLKKTGANQGGTTPIIIEKEPNQKIPPGFPPELIPFNMVRTIEIKTPMVGTFYQSPSPETAPYVEIGQVIEPGQVICIIEAMKLMNEIKAEIKGKITEILVENAEPVEFGQPLFLIDPL